MLKSGMTSPQPLYLKLQPQGRVLIPSEARARLDVKEGDELIMLVIEDGYKLTSRRLLAQSLYGSLKKEGEAAGRDFTQELLDERRAEAKKKGW